MWRRTTFASLAVCLAGGAAFWHGTDGLSALTSEQARRLSIASSPRQVPDVALEDQDGREFTLAQFQGTPVAVEFIYTRCQTLCALLSAGMRRFSAEQRSFTRGSRVQLVSISFDPVADSTQRLREYASHYGADGDTWRLARVRDARDLDILLRTFGVVVIPDGAGGFQHNAAVHLLNTEGRLARVLDADATPPDLARGEGCPVALIGVLIIVLLALPPARGALEGQMILHMLVQIPLLAVAGGIVALALPVRWRAATVPWNRFGITGTLLALIVSTWWMVPRALDGALSSGAMELLKFVSLPLLVGAPVALSWRELPFVGKGFVLANVLPMWAVVGWLYIASPERLCNYYLVDQQVIAGYGLIVLSIAAAVAIASIGMFTTPRAAVR